MRILIFIGLKISELIIAPVLLLIGGFYFMELLANMSDLFNFDVIPNFIQALIGVLFFTGVFSLIMVLYNIIPLFVSHNWDKAGEIEDKLRRK